MDPPLPADADTVTEEDGGSALEQAASIRASVTQHAGRNNNRAIMEILRRFRIFVYRTDVFGRPRPEA